jgi:MHS family proline/betaine transporter-like MFS transporter
MPASPARFSSTALPATNNRKVHWAVILGNGLIAYDFTVYSFSAVVIGRLFFPFGNHLLSLLLSFATFGAGFIMRPLGAVVIGRLADIKGRKTGLVVASVLMTLGTGIIALVPTYDSIGPAATILLVAARLIQGFVAGGEVGVASTVLLEAGQRDRCYRTSWRGASQGAAALLGAAVGATTNALLSTEQIEQWGWRVPFIIGMLIAPVGWYLRREMIEAPVQTQPHNSLYTLFGRHRRALGCGILLMAAPSASIYIMVFYLPTYLVTVLHQPPVISLLASCIASTVIFSGTLLMAKLADRRGDLKPVQAFALVGSIVITYPAFLILTHDAGQFWSLLIIACHAAFSLTTAGISSVMIMSAFPRHHRAASMSIIYSVGVTLFGGFSPVIVTWLIGVTGMHMMPAWYLLVAFSLSLLALLAFPLVSADRQA